ncbi:hypothetical protein BX600DRAFT_472943 [Xylariales sp. PMI_506]|nr:hypothetical protein BX600DRAFT_472943 [Xylariales sp. PMI_506]
MLEQRIGGHHCHHRRPPSLPALLHRLLRIGLTISAGVPAAITALPLSKIHCPYHLILVATAKATNEQAPCFAPAWMKSARRSRELGGERRAVGIADNVGAGAKGAVVGARAGGETQDGCMASTRCGTAPGKRRRRKVMESETATTTATSAPVVSEVASVAVITTAAADRRAATRTATTTLRDHRQRRRH